MRKTVIVEYVPFALLVLQARNNSMKNQYVKTRYNREELAMFKGIIQQKMESTQTELNHLKDSLQSHIRQSDKRSDLDSGTSAQESQREFINRMIQRQYSSLRSLQYALIRIENKTYGICRITGKLIDKRRLVAVPQATLSINAKQIEQKKTA